MNKTEKTALESKIEQERKEAAKENIIPDKCVQYDGGLLPM